MLISTDVNFTEELSRKWENIRTKQGAKETRYILKQWKQIMALYIIQSELRNDEQNRKNLIIKMPMHSY